MQQPRRRRNMYPIKLNNSDASAENKFKRRIIQVHRRRITLLLAVGLVILVALGSRVVQAQQEREQTQVELNQHQKRLQQTKQKQANLQTEVRQLHDPEYLDNLIRYRFNYSKDNEIIYNIPNEANQNLNF